MNETSDQASRSPLDSLALVPVVMRNLTPVAGAIFLGWSAPNLLLLYFVDTVLAFASVLLLVMAHITGMGEGKGLPSGPGDWSKAVFGTILATAIIMLPFGIPLFFLLAEFGIDLGAMLADPGFRVGLALQAMMSLQVFLNTHRDLARREDDEAVLKRRVQFIFARWMAVIFAAMTGFVGLLGPRIGGILMLIVYAGASIYAELFPQRIDAWLNPKKAPALPQARAAARKRRR